MWWLRVSRLCGCVGWSCAVVVCGVVLGAGWLLLRGGRWVLSVGSLWWGGSAPATWVLRGPAHCCWPLVRALLVCGCSGGVLLSRSLVGAVPLALGGLASGFGMGPGVSPPRCGRRDGGGVWCVGLGSPPGGGVGGLVLGCVVDAVGSPGACVAFLSAPSSCSRGRPGVGVVPCVGGLCGVCSCWPISTGRLSPLPGVHLRPIHPVVCWGPSATPVGVVWRPGLGGGFPLRCFQRLPVPNVANQRCPWRDNWRTRGSSVPVLSYWGRVSSSLLRAQRIGTELSHDVLNPARVPL